MKAEGKYKKTEVGVIPEDWEVRELSSLLKNNPDYGINAPAVKFNSNLPTYLRITDISEDGRFIKSNISSIDNPLADRYFLEDGDIVFARTGASVGKSYLYNKTDGELVFAGFLIRAKPISTVLNCKFLFYFVKGNYFKNWVSSNSMRSGQPGINSNQLGCILLPLPPLPEQTAIATALSDMDALIAQTEKLIEKKKAIKQGAMQELLRPKEGWVKKKLGEVAKIQTGKKNNQDKVENGTYPFFVRSQTIEKINTYSYDGEAILIPGEGNIGKIFHYIIGKFDFHQRVYKISDFREGYSGKYIYRFITEYFGSHALGNTVKATVDSLRLPTFQVFEIPFPQTLEEQNQISQILTDIDEQIQTLESKLQKLKLQKQGMMQALLTGKIRLV